MTGGAGSCREHNRLGDEEVVVEGLEERREETARPGLVDGSRRDDAVRVAERRDRALELGAEALRAEGGGELWQEEP